MTCKCGLDTHKSTRSRLCHLFKPPIKELNRKTDAKTESFVIKLGLNAFCAGPPHSDLHKSINDVVLIVSKVMFEFSIYVNFLLQKQLAAPQANGSLVKPKFLHLLYAIQGKSKFPLDPQYAQMRHKFQLGKYNVCKVNYTFQEAIRQYETNFMNNVTVHMKSRLIRYFCTFARPGSDGILDKAAATLAVTQLLLADNDDNEFKLNFSKLKLDWFKFVPLLFSIQKQMNNIGKKSFAVVPIHKGGRIHCLFTTSAVAELLGITVGEALNRDKVRSIWEKAFNFKDFENLENNISFDYSFSTNGIDVSVHLSRPLRVPSEIVKKPLIETFEQIIGIDPGLRFMFGSVAMLGFDQDFENGVEINKLLKSANWQYITKNIERKSLLLKWTREFETSVRARCEQYLNIGPSAEDFTLFTEVKLSHLNQKFNLYSQTKIARLKFDKHICTKREIDKFVNKLTNNTSTLIFLGNCEQAANSPMKGYIKGPLRELTKRLMEKEGCTVLMTDEFR